MRCTNRKSDKSKKSSVIFLATFGNKVRATICAAVGADASITVKPMLYRINNVDIELVLEKLAPPHEFNMAADNTDESPTTISCYHAVTVDAQLHIHHG